MLLHCGTCGPLEYALMDGYAFGDTLLEGVMFRVAVKGTTVSVTTDPVSADYMRGLNEKRWLKEATKHAKQEDLMQCPKCRRDVDGPGAEA